MLKYDQPAFTRAMELMKTVCTELDQYEEEIRSLSAVWDADQVVPAPRQRLKSCLAEMEQSETSLNLMQRKLGTIARIYERTEQRALEMAEEAAPAVDPSPEGADAFPLYGYTIDSALWTSGPTTDLRLLKPLFPNWHRLRPIRPILPFLWPLGPWVPHHPWFIPGRPVPFHWPPRRPVIRIDRELLRRLLRRWKPMPTGLITRPIIEVGPLVLSNQGTAPAVRSLSIESAQRQQRRQRISSLFRPV